MARTDNDSWDITESVGATALGVAMVRAAESDCECPLFTDRYELTMLAAALADDLGMSRIPVLGAYAQLLAEGYIESRSGAGTFVTSGGVPGDAIAVVVGGREP